MIDKIAAVITTSDQAKRDAAFRAAFEKLNADGYFVSSFLVPVGDEIKINNNSATVVFDELLEDGHHKICYKWL